MAETMQRYTTQEIAARFHELAQQEKWFEIQEELFADHVQSIEPPQSPYLKNADGKDAVRKKGEHWVSRIEQAHHLHTTHPFVSGNHLAVGRTTDITVQDLGNVKIEELMVYEVKNGQIVLEQFFY